MPLAQVFILTPGTQKHPGPPSLPRPVAISPTALGVLYSSIMTGKSWLECDRTAGSSRRQHLKPGPGSLAEVRVAEIKCGLMAHDQRLAERQGVITGCSSNL